MTLAATLLLDAQETAAQAAGRAGVSVLELSTPAETERAADLLREVWGGAEPPVPGNLLRTVQHAGGYVFGAYDELGTLVAASMGLLSTQGLHSHLTGVVPSALRRGLGLAMKQHQRTWALQRDMSVVTWTCDPLVRRNVAFNLHALGADVHAYLPDHYGAMADEVNRGDESDRLEFWWELSSPRAVAASHGRLPWVEGTRTVELPADIEALRRTDPAAAVSWRCRVREDVLPALAEGRRILGLNGAGALVLA